MLKTESVYRQSRVPAEHRVDIIDTLYRFAAGQDFKDPELFRSAFAEDATLDFTGPARRFGVEIPTFVGRDAIADAILTATSKLDTTHTISNDRIIGYDGTHSALTALIEAQHLPIDGHDRNLLLKNRLDVQLILADDGWVITHMLFQNVWMEGDPAVLFPG